MTDAVYLSFMPDRHAFGISEDEIEKITAAGKQPKIMIAPDDWKKLNPSASSPNARPLIAFLMGRENGFYLMLENYVRALAQTGVDLKILTHCDGPDALNDVDGLILPGRLDDPLNTFAAPSLPKKPVLCSLTYVNMVREAEKRGIPVLGIAAGAKIIGRLHGIRPLRSPSDDRSRLRVKSLKLLSVFPETELYRIMGNVRKMKIYSVEEPHLQVDAKSDMKIYAVSGDVPEAWGKENILCVRWEPEDVSVDADKYTLNVYKWLEKKAKEHQKSVRGKAHP
jgi:hypothetical protein